MWTVSLYHPNTFIKKQARITFLDEGMWCRHTAAIIAMNSTSPMDPFAPWMWIIGWGVSRISAAVPELSVHEPSVPASMKSWGT